MLATLLLALLALGGSAEAIEPIWVHDDTSYTAVAVTATGQRLVTGDDYGRVTLRDSDGNEFDGWESSSGRVTTVAVKVGGTYLAAGYNDGQIRLFEKGRTGPVWTFDTQEGAIEGMTIEGDYLLAWNSNGAWLFDTTVATEYLVHSYSATITAAALFDNGLWAVASDDGKLTFYDGNTFVKELGNSTNIINTMVFHPTDELLFVGFDDGNIIPYDRHANEYNGIKLDNSILALAVDTRDGVRLLAATSGPAVHRLDFDTSSYFLQENGSYSFANSMYHIQASDEYFIVRGDDEVALFDTEGMIWNINSYSLRAMALSNQARTIMAITDDGNLHRYQQGYFTVSYDARRPEGDYWLEINHLSQPMRLTRLTWNLEDSEGTSTAFGVVGIRNLHTGSDTEGIESIDTWSRKHDAGDYPDLRERAYEVENETNEYHQVVYYDRDYDDLLSLGDEFRIRSSDAEHPADDTYIFSLSHTAAVDLEPRLTAVNVQTGIALNKKPLAEIKVFPPVMAAGENYWVEGSGSDDDGSIQWYEWTSDTMGGTLLDAETGELMIDQIGQQNVYFRVCDDRDAWSDFATVSIWVADRPNVRIEEIWYDDDREKWYLRGAADDYEHGVNENDMVWYAERRGSDGGDRWELYRGHEGWVQIPEGDYVIRLEGTNGVGLTSESTRDIEVNEDGRPVGSESDSFEERVGPVLLILLILLTVRFGYKRIKRRRSTRKRPGSRPKLPRAPPLPSQSAAFRPSPPPGTSNMAGRLEAAQSALSHLAPAVQYTHEATLVKPMVVKPETPKPATPQWKPPLGLKGDETVLAEFFGKRWECYRTAPANEKLLDELHNKRERYAISSYFEIPTSPVDMLQEWALPPNLRGNVHLDAKRQQIVDTIIASKPDHNFVIIGEPGVGKTALLFEVFDRFMASAPTGIFTTDAIGTSHQRFNLRLFYDDIPENLGLVQAIADRGTHGVIVTSREADWKGLPADFQQLFDRLTVPLFSDEEMGPLARKMLDFSALTYDDGAIDSLISYAEGSPIYVWSMVREMIHKGVRTLSLAYIQENATRGMTNYVALLLQRLLKDGEHFRPGGLHVLTALMFLADYLEERQCHELYFHAFASRLSKHTRHVFTDEMQRDTFNRTMAYLSGEGDRIRFPHDTWVDVLGGAGALNPFKAELSDIDREFTDTGLYEQLKREAVTAAWKTLSARYSKNPTKQKDSLLVLADTLLRNFTLTDLQKLGVDIGQIREVASTYSHLPLAATLISKIQAAQPSQITKVINIQDSVISRSNIGGDDDEIEQTDSIMTRNRGI